jgi:hypothetical protein
MTDDQARSEQQENLELEAEPREDDPRRWRADDPDRARESTGAPPGRQITPPGGGEPPDREPDEIAEDAGAYAEIGPEQHGLRVERGERRSGRTGD